MCVSVWHVREKEREREIKRDKERQREKGVNQCRLAWVICVALVKWTSMMQQAQSLTNAGTSNLSVSSAEPL